MPVVQIKPLSQGFADWPRRPCTDSNLKSGEIAGGIVDKNQPGRPASLRSLSGSNSEGLPS